MNLILSWNAFGFYGLALGGIVMHAVVKWARGELPVSVFSYFFQTNTKASALMAMTALGGTASVLLSGTISNLHDGAHVLAAWGIGYAADSALNTGSSK
jgi:hypothetical protein